MDMIVVLDFDGVIIDSAYECMLMANTTYLLNDERIIPDRLIVPPDHIADQFLANRYKVRFAGEYWLLLHYLYEGINIPDVKTFQTVAERHMAVIMGFEKKFFKVRRRVFRKNPDYWFGLHRLYDEFSLYWQELRERVEDVYIVSMKDSVSIKTLLDHFGIRVQQNKIFGREGGLFKNEILIDLAVKLGRDLSEFMFMDDHLPQLKSVASLGVSCYWASWGYWKCDSSEIPVNIHVCDNLNKIMNNVKEF